MVIKVATGFSKVLILPATLLVIGIGTTAAVAQIKLYNPVPLPPSNEVTDKLSEKDIPTGEGGFARDYKVRLNKGDNLAIDLTSENFDSTVTLLAADGSTIAENDDGPDGTTNSLLFIRITHAGVYFIRVQAFGETGVGSFKLKVTRLQPVQSAVSRQSNKASVHSTTAP